MRMRSLLFVPGDRPDRMEKALAAGADALILDLEDSVVMANKQNARDHVAAFVAESASNKCPRLFVRINPLTTELADEDLTAVAPHEPCGIVLPKAEGAGSVRDLDCRLEKLGNTRATILPIATETPTAIFALGQYSGVTPRLCGLTWGAEDLPAAIGGVSREEDGRFTPPYEMVRALSLFGAHAANVPAIETVFPALNDEAGLSTYAARARRDGFSGMLAVHPNQIALINLAFTPSENEVKWARQVVNAFSSRPDEGALQLDGKMIDAPHLKLALRMLSAAAILPD
jgi:citrate lyase subunit beta/citryl-CoA lyase